MQAYYVTATDPRLGILGLLSEPKIEDQKNFRSVGQILNLGIFSKSREQEL